jgi:hypothetical protein
MQLQPHPGAGVRTRLVWALPMMTTVTSGSWNPVITARAFSCVTVFTSDASPSVSPRSASTSGKPSGDRQALYA